MNKAWLIAPLALAVAACGEDVPRTAEEVHEERAEALREGAEYSTPEGANQLEALAREHERKAEALSERPGAVPADPSQVNAPIPDNVSVGEPDRNASGR